VDGSKRGGPRVPDYRSRKTLGEPARANHGGVSGLILLTDPRAVLRASNAAGVLPVLLASSLTLGLNGRTVTEESRTVPGLATGGAFGLAGTDSRQDPRPR
jgi:hypothetical protein